MSYVRIWVHCVWGTKNNVPYFTNTNKNNIIGNIRENAREKDIYVDFINAHKEHIHCLISLNPDQAISKVMQLIKGESSFWINRNKIIKTRFEWADELSETIS
jgi:REP element-mobilizing transposase RayT